MIRMRNIDLFWLQITCTTLGNEYVRLHTLGGMEALSKPSAISRNNSNTRAFEKQIFLEENIIMIDFRIDVKLLLIF